MGLPATGRPPYKWADAHAGKHDRAQAQIGRTDRAVDHREVERIAEDVTVRFA